MSVPVFYPAEIVTGYVGRLRQSEGRSSNAAVGEELHRMFGSGDVRQSLVKRLATLTSVKFDQIIAEHTLFPLYRAFSLDDVRTPYGVGIAETRLQWTTRISARQYQYCPLCVEEDLNHLGLSYWRRHHQILGIDRCPEHRSQTLIRVTGKSGPERCPHHHLNDLRIVHLQQPIKRSHSESFDERYLNICMRLLQLSSPTGKRTLLAMCKCRARSFGLTLSRDSTNRGLANFIRKTAPPTWLARHFPRVAFGMNENSFNNMLSSPYNSVSAELSVLVCAAFYSSSEEALQRLEVEQSSQLHQPQLNEFAGGIRVSLTRKI